MFPVSSYARLIACLLAAMVLGGCGSSYSAINGRDDDVFFPGLRVSVPILEQEERLHGQSDHALEFGLSRGRGAGQQSLARNDSILFNGTTFSGPVDLHQEYALTAADVILRFRFPRQARTFLEYLGGLRSTSLDLALQSPTASTQETMTNLSPAIGIGAGVRLADYLTLDLRFLADLNNDGGTLHSRDLELSFWISPSAAVTAGHRRWQYKKEEDGASAINRLVWSGFTGGICFSF